MLDNGRWFEVLFGRLSWASGLVRERAAAEIVGLLLDPAFRDEVFQRLVQWTSLQSLESLGALGLVVLCHARDRGASFTSSEIASSFVRYPSLLSWLLRRDIDRQLGAAPDLFPMHSGAADCRFRADTFFEKYIRFYVPPRLVNVARSVDVRFGIEFYRQWAYEWSRLHERAKRKPLAPSVDLWTRGSERLVVLDVVESEFYRSGFLRAIAWATDRRRISGAFALNLAEEMCPVNLDVWRLPVSAQPSWWPTRKALGRSADTAPAELAQYLERLWRDQFTSEWVVAEASGRVCNGDLIYDLEILGALQSCSGPCEPELSVAFGECRAEVEVLSKYLRVEGKLVARDSELAVKVGDWILRPLSRRLVERTNSRWQWWRGARGIWCLSPGQSSGDVVLKVESHGIDFESGGTVLGRWIDWKQDFHERSRWSVPPATGQALSIRRDVIERAAAADQSSFVWLCRWCAYSDRSEYTQNDAAVRDGYFEFGASRIVNR